MKKVRDSKIELLRIVSMLMIIGHHYALYGVKQVLKCANLVYSEGSCFNKIFTEFLIPGGVVGVSIFFIISGYYGYNSKRNNYRKILEETIFYSTACIIVGLLLDILDIYNIRDVASIKNLLIGGIFLPLGSSAYWFVSVYFIILLIKPVLNDFLENLGYRQFVVYLVLFWLVEYGLSGYICATYFAVTKGILFYCVGAFTKKYQSKLRFSKGIFLSVGIITWILYAVGNYYIDNYQQAITFIDCLNMYVWGPLSAITLFLWMIQCKEFCNEIINKVGGCMLAVYLIHDNKILRVYIWDNLFKVSTKQYQSVAFPVFALITITIVLLVGVFCDLIKKKYINNIINKFNNYVISKVR